MNPTAPLARYQEGPILPWIGSGTIFSIPELCHLDFGATPIDSIGIVDDLLSMEALPPGRILPRFTHSWDILAVPLSWEMLGDSLRGRRLLFAR